VIIPATMKVDDRQVYIVKGDVVMFPDGTAVDVHNSSESVVVMDVQTGEYQFTSPDQIFQVSEAVNPQDELDTAFVGDRAGADEYLWRQCRCPPKESTEGEEPQQTNEAPATADTAEYDRGYEQGLEKAAKDDDAWIANHINILSQNTPESMPDTMKGELDAYLYEQQRRAQSAPESARKRSQSYRKPSFRRGNRARNVPKCGKWTADRTLSHPPQRAGRADV